MPSFKYRFVDDQGNTQDSEAEAGDKESLVRELRNKGYTILEIQEVAEANVKAAPSKRRIDWGYSTEDLALFTRQLATMLGAGLPFPKTLALLRKRCPSPSFGLILDDISTHVQQGGRLSEGLAKHPLTFDGMYVNMVKVGEASGKLPAMFTRLADLLDKTVALQRKVQSALTYPAFILCFTAILSYAIVAFLMPMFTPMFISSGLDIPKNYPLTYFLMQLSHLANNPVMIFVGILAMVGGGYGLRRMSRTRQGRLTLDKIVFRIPVLSTVVRYAAVAAFARTLSTLIGSGMPLVQALGLVSSAAGNAVVAKGVENIAAELSRGRRLSEAVESQSAVFPDLLIQMVQVGEESGALGDMLERTADYYDSQMDSAVQRLVAMLEPLMMVVVGGIVCTFVMAVLLPIMGLAKIGS